MAVGRAGPAQASIRHATGQDQAVARFQIALALPLLTCHTRGSQRPDRGSSPQAASSSTSTSPARPDTSGSRPGNTGAARPGSGRKPTRIPGSTPTGTGMQTPAPRPRPGPGDGRRGTSTPASRDPRGSAGRGRVPWRRLGPAPGRDTMPPTPDRSRAAARFNQPDKSSRLAWPCRYFSNRAQWFSGSRASRAVRRLRPRRGRPAAGG